MAGSGTPPAAAAARPRSEAAARRVLTAATEPREGQLQILSNSGALTRYHSIQVQRALAATRTRKAGDGGIG